MSNPFIVSIDLPRLQLKMHRANNLQSFRQRRAAVDQYVAAGLRHCARLCRNAKCWVKRGEPRKIGLSPSKLTVLFKKDRDLTK
jgi:hypothetical protein